MTGSPRPLSPSRAAAVLLPLLYLLGTGLAGLDFGKHWDEFRQFEAVRRTAQTGIFLPGFYAYPSATYGLVVVAHLPEWGEAVKGAERPEQVLPAFETRVGRPAAWMRTRALFLFVGSLAVVWIHFLALAWGRSPLEALLASSLVATSWEIGYHLRWIAPDGLLLSAGTLALALATLAALRPERPRLLDLAALAAGLATGTKYPGGIFLLAVVALAATAPGRRSPGSRLAGAIRAALLGAGAYLVTTPGTLLEPFWFATQVLGEIRHYATGHYGHTVTAGLPHLAKILEYAGLVLLSPFAPLAFLFALLALLGTASVARESRRAALVIAGVPALYVLYMGMQRAMIARNFLLLAPPLALLAARGALEIIGRIPGRVAPRVAAAALVVAVAANATFGLAAARSIRGRSDAATVAKFAAWAAGEGPVRVSPKLAAALARERLSIPPPPADPNAPVALWMSECAPWQVRPTNDRGALRAWFGPREVNLPWYTTWDGDDHVVVVDPRRAAGLLGGPR